MLKESQFFSSSLRYRYTSLSVTITVRITVAISNSRFCERLQVLEVSLLQHTSVK